MPVRRGIIITNFFHTPSLPVTSSSASSASASSASSLSSPNSAIAQHQQEHQQQQQQQKLQQPTTSTTSTTSSTVNHALIQQQQQHQGLLTFLINNNASESSSQQQQVIPLSPFEQSVIDSKILSHFLPSTPTLLEEPSSSSSALQMSAPAPPTSTTPTPTQQQQQQQLLQAASIQQQLQQQLLPLPVVPHHQEDANSSSSPSSSSSNNNNAANSSELLLKIAQLENIIVNQSALVSQLVQNLTCTPPRPEGHFNADALITPAAHHLKEIIKEKFSTLLLLSEVNVSIRLRKTMELVAFNAPFKRFLETKCAGGPVPGGTAGGNNDTADAAIKAVDSWVLFLIITHVQDVAEGRVETTFKHITLKYLLSFPEGKLVLVQGTAHYDGDFMWIESREIVR